MNFGIFESCVSAQANVNIYLKHLQLENNAIHFQKEHLRNLSGSFELSTEIEYANSTSEDQVYVEMEILAHMLILQPANTGKLVNA